MPPTKKLKDLLFIDVETTGLDPAKHELIEVAAIRTTPDGKSVLGKYEAKLLPKNIAGADPTALKVNGYTESEWSPDKCVDASEVATSLNRLGMDCVLVGQNVSFDEGFLLPLFKSVNLKPAWGYHKVDTVALAWPVYTTTNLEGLSLSKLCAFLGVTTVPNHRAAADVEACRNVYVLLMEKYTK